MATRNGRWNLLISTNAVTTAFVIGQLVAFAREAVIAAYFGATRSTDAYFIAFSIPDLFLQLSLSGAAASAVIPLVASYLTSRRELTEWDVVSPIVCFYVAISVAGVLVGWYAMPSLVTILAPGFDAEAAALAASLARIMMPAVLFLTISATLAGLLNYLGHFFVPAMRFALQSAFVILAAVVFGRSFGVGAAAIGVLAGSLAGTVSLLLLTRSATALTAWIRLDSGMEIIKNYLKLALPIMLTGLAIQVSLFAERFAATHFEPGSVVALVLARKVAFMSIAVGVQPLLTVIYPKLAVAAATQSLSDLRRHFRFAMLGTLVPMCMLGAIVWFLAEPITRVLFERGLFQAQATARVAGLLRWFSVGLPIFSLNALLVRVYHAKQLVLPPLAIGLASLVPYFVLLYVLPSRMGLGGIVVALVVADGLRLVMLTVMLENAIPGLLPWPRKAIAP